MRNLQIPVFRDPQDLSFQDSQPLHAGALLALLEEELESQADAEEGSIFLHDLMDQLHQAVFFKVFHGGPEGAHSRKDDLIRM